MLQEQINKDYIAAMKAKESEKAQTLNFLRAQLKNVVIEKRVDKLEDVDVIAVVKKQVKQRKDSIEQFTEAGRQELADKEQQELDILADYLPEELSEGAIKKIVEEAITETEAKTMKDMGNVMKAVKEKTAGVADNAIVSRLVKDTLNA